MKSKYSRIYKTIIAVNAITLIITTVVMFYGFVVAV